MKNTRRDFLRKSLGASAAMLAVGPGCEVFPRKSSSGSRMQLGLVTYLWGKDWDLPTVIKNCEKSSIFAVELRSTHAHGVEPTMSATERAEVKKRFADSPVTFLGPGSNERFDNPDPVVLRQAIQVTRGFLQLSHDTGGSGVKVKPDRFYDGVPREKTVEQIGKSLNALGEFAADLGQEVRLEVHGQCSPLPVIKQIMDVADHPSVAVCWNSNDVDLQGKGLEHNFNLVKGRFGRTAHVRELNVGEYPYQDLMNLFVEMDYDGWVCLECRTAPKDRVAALIEQREIFEDMVDWARKSK